MKGLADQLVGDMGTVEVAGVDVVDAGGQGLAQHGEGVLAILRGPEDAGAGELHGAVAHAIDGAVAQAEGAGGGDVGHGGISRAALEGDMGAVALRDNPRQSARAVQDGEQCRRT
ncbi:MAG: hypothetical protein JWO83_3942 [Caulobacteraceae bacterium]|nr:hypothetical protein [Caulobacteraceae bacterium]